jgi:hypothetical protein
VKGAVETLQDCLVHAREAKSWIESVKDHDASETMLRAVVFETECLVDKIIYQLGGAE